MGGDAISRYSNVERLDFLVSYADPEAVRGSWSAVLWVKELTQRRSSVRHLDYIDESRIGETSVKNRGSIEYGKL
jgi:hypothetical protein